jgi:hypothetical protein
MVRVLIIFSILSYKENNCKQMALRFFNTGVIVWNYQEHRENLPLLTQL